MKSENTIVKGLIVLHIINKVILNDDKFVCLRIHMWIQYVGLRLPHIYILDLICIKKTEVK